LREAVFALSWHFWLGSSVGLVVCLLTLTIFFTSSERVRPPGVFGILSGLAIALIGGLPLTMVLRQEKENDKDTHT